MNLSAHHKLSLCFRKYGRKTVSLLSFPVVPNQAYWYHSYIVQYVLNIVNLNMMFCWPRLMLFCVQIRCMTLVVMKDANVPPFAMI